MQCPLIRVRINRNMVQKTVKSVSLPEAFILADIYGEERVSFLDDSVLIELDPDEEWNRLAGVYGDVGDIPRVQSVFGRPFEGRLATAIQHGLSKPRDNVPPPEAIEPDIEEISNDITKITVQPINDQSIMKRTMVTRLEKMKVDIPTGLNKAQIAGMYKLQGEATLTALGLPVPAGSLLKLEEALSRALDTVEPDPHVSEAVVMA